MNVSYINLWCRNKSIRITTTSEILTPQCAYAHCSLKCRVSNQNYVPGNKYLCFFAGNAYYDLVSTITIYYDTTAFVSMDICNAAIHVP